MDYNEFFRKIVLAIILFFHFTYCFAGDGFNYKRDFKKILERTKDANDPLFYDALIVRFLKNDKSLTDFEVLSLLIGFTDKPQYKPYEDLDVEQSIYDINGYGEYEKGLKEATAFLKLHPLSITVIFEKSYSFYKMGQSDSASYYSYQGKRIFAAMYFSGDAKSLETAAFSLSPVDGQSYIRKYLGWDIGSMGSASDGDGNFIDVLEAIGDDGTKMDLHFNIQHAIMKMMIFDVESEPKDKKRKQRSNEVMKLDV